jgi:hypothetical protein
MSILPQLLLRSACSSRRHPPLLVGYAQHLLEGRSYPRASFIPTQIKDYGLGILACLAKLVSLCPKVLWEKFKNCDREFGCRQTFRLFHEFWPIKPQ